MWPLCYAWRIAVELGCLLFNRSSLHNTSSCHTLHLFPFAIHRGYFRSISGCHPSKARNERRVEVEQAVPRHGCSWRNETALFRRWKLWASGQEDDLFNRLFEWMHHAAAACRQCSTLSLDHYGYRFGPTVVWVRQELKRLMVIVTRKH